MKKLIIAILIIFVCVLIFAGCEIKDETGVVIGKKRNYAHITRGIYTGDAYFLIVKTESGREIYKSVDETEYKNTKIGDVATVRVVNMGG